MSAPDALALSGLFNPRGKCPSFLILFFGSSSEPWLQNIDSAGVVSDFQRCAVAIGEVLTAPRRTLRKGELPIYGFQFPDGTVEVGTKRELGGVLQSNLPEMAPFPFVRLEVCEFLGLEAEQRAAATAASAVLASYDSEIAQRWAKHHGVEVNDAAPLAANQRVFHRRHPEYGFGLIKLVEEDAFGDQRCLVAFEQRIGTLPAPVAELEAVGQPDDDLARGSIGAADVFSRKLAAALIVQENNRSGVFMRTAVEPQPHQAFLLEKVWGGGRFGHLLADDVGLGKTIEAGLIIASLLQQRADARVLIICPAGVALQWQDEMEEHFSLYFQVLGSDGDFRGRNARSWQGHHRVIAPIDRIKSADAKAVLAEVGPFDLVVCDEAHRLSARADFFGGPLRKTANYRLVEDMVKEQMIDFVLAADGSPRSPRLLLLSATPHQGDDLRFAHLLSLIRPDQIPVPSQFGDQPIPPEVLRECVSRTPKSHAVGWDRQPLFKGHQTTTVDIHWSPQEKVLSQLLTRYVETGFRQASPDGPISPLIVSLVMHTFQKLAASSWAALAHALRARLDSLEGRSAAGTSEVWEEDGETELDDAWEEARLSKAELFAAEPAMLRELIAAIAGLAVDSKWSGCQELLGKMEFHQPGEKVLFFTQYRATQELLAAHLRRSHPNSRTTLLNGSMNLEQRREARSEFEGPARFLVSTEAGGEGINLQKNCHLLINYDVTWNPMRMQQRIGRLDRYGQKERVEVFNLRVPESWDHRVFARIEERLASVQTTLGPIAAQLEDYREMILGTIASEISETRMFAEQRHPPAEVDNARIDEIIRQAIGSAEKWRSMLGGNLGFVADQNLRPPGLAARDFEKTYALLLANYGIALQRTKLPDNAFLPGVLHFSPPAQFREPSLRAAKERYVVFDRGVYADVRSRVLKRAGGQAVKPVLAGFGDPLTNWLFEKVFEARPIESAFSLALSEKAWPSGNGVLLVGGLRWLGTARRIRGPDSLVGCFLPAGESQWIRVADGHLMELALAAETAPARTVRIDSAAARKIVQDELRRAVETHNPNARSSADWSWMLAAVITCRRGR